MTEPKRLRRRTRDGAASVRTAHQVKAQARALNAGLARAVAAAPESAAPASDAAVAELWLFGLVGGWWRGFDAESVANALRGLGDVDEIHVFIHSPGGLAGEGVAIANLFRNHKAKVTTVVVGMAASAASVIAVAGDEVVMSPGAQLMLHDAATGMSVWGDAKWLREQVAELQRVADWIDSQSQNYAGIYAFKAGGTDKQWREVMTANGLLGTWYTGEAALAAKLIDRVGTVAATGSPPVDPADDADWDENDEEMLARVEHDLQILDQCVAASVRDAWQGHAPRTPKPPIASADGNTQPEGAAVVDLNDTQIAALREQVGFPADADADTIVAAVTEALTERAETPPAPATPQVPEGMSLVDSAILEQLQAGASAGQTAQRTLAAQDRDTAINAALAAGKLAATSRDSFAAAWDKDPEGTRAILDALTPGLVPTTEAGHGDQPEVTADDELYALVFGAEKKGA